MKRLERFKYDIIHTCILIGIFVLSVILKNDYSNKPIGRHHEWIAAHTLITAEVWEKNGGPFYSNFTPVYTYPKKANFGRRMLGGVTNSKGHHYVSYPPFSFISAYYYMKLLGGTSVTNIRSFSLLIGFFSAFILIWIVRSLEKSRNKISWIGIFAAILFLFNTGNLWSFGNLYFADILVIPFLLWSFFLAQKLILNRYNSERLILTGVFVSVFLTSYTEWIGIFWAFWLVIFFLLHYFRYRKKTSLKGFLIAGVSSTVAALLTFFQYSNIKDTSTLLATWSFKLKERTGNGLMSIEGNDFHLFSADSYRMFWKHLWTNMSALLIFSLVLSVLFISLLIIPKTRGLIYQVKYRLRLVFILFLSLISHLIIFFNFNILHDFGGIKISVFIIIINASFLVLIFEIFSSKMRGIFYTILGLVISCVGIHEFTKYKQEFTYTNEDNNLRESRSIMANEASSEIYIFSNLPNGPEQVFIAKQDVFPAENEIKVKALMKSMQIDSAYFYFSTNNLIITRTGFERDTSDTVRITSKATYETK